MEVLSLRNQFPIVESANELVIFSPNGFDLIEHWQEFPVGTTTVLVLVLRSGPCGVDLAETQELWQLFAMMSLDMLANFLFAIDT